MFSTVCQTVSFLFVVCRLNELPVPEKRQQEIWRWNKIFRIQNKSGIPADIYDKLAGEHNSECEVFSGEGNNQDQRHRRTWVFYRSRPRHRYLQARERPISLLEFHQYFDSIFG